MLAHSKRILPTYFKLIIECYRCNSLQMRTDCCSTQDKKNLSNIYYKYKSVALFTLINRAFKLSSSYALFHNELAFLKHYFQNNEFSISYFNSTIKKFLNQQYHNKPLISTVLKQTPVMQ